MQVTICHGICNKICKEFPEGTTVGSVLDDAEVKEHSGFGDNVEAHSGGKGEKMSRDHVLLGGEVLIVANESCDKAGDEPRKSGKDMARLLRRRGFAHERTNGSHHIYVKDGYPPIPVPIHGSETLDYGTQRSIMKDAGLTKEDLF